jgi:uncharacterized damage-inducible protein DinB
LSANDPAVDYSGRLRVAAAPLLARVRAVPGSALHTAPDEQTWSAMKILAHVAEFVPYWAEQARTVAMGADDLAFGRSPEDPDRIAAVVEHADDTLDAATERLHGALTRAAVVLSAIPAGAWTKRGRHSRRGDMTVAEIVEVFMLGHLEEHARQLDGVTAPATSTGSRSPA